MDLGLVFLPWLVAEAIGLVSEALAVAHNLGRRPRVPEVTEHAPKTSVIRQTPWHSSTATSITRLSRFRPTALPFV